MLNGDITSEVTQHYEVGCCVNEHKVHTREITIDNVMAAIVQSGMFGDVEKTKPKKARWLSTSLVLAIIVLGNLFHRFVPRVWVLAFPTVPRPAGLTDFHLVLHCKTKRVSEWFKEERMPVSTALVSIISGPADHCNQRVQHMDADCMGGALCCGGRHPGPLVYG